MKIIIPARGGSKRIPDKNIIDVGGIPLIAHVIKASLELTSEVYVSTDSEKIEETAKEYNAKVIKRPAELATDEATTNLAIKHFLEQVPATNYFACVQSTSPFLTSHFLKMGFNKIESKVYNSVISVSENSSFFWDDEHKPINFDMNRKPRTQDMNKWYTENGAFYITSKEKFLETKNIINEKVGFIVMPKIMSFEIDTFEDLNIIESLIQSGAVKI